MLTKIRSRIERLRNERAETLPAAIVTGIVSSIILLGLAGVTATVVSQQKNAEVVSEATTTATNIDVSLRSDATAATTIKPISATSVQFHVPASTGNQCKLVTWNVDGSNLTRQLAVYNGSKTVNGNVECDTASSVVVNSKRTLTTALDTSAAATFKYSNSLGRTLVVDSAGTVAPSDPSQQPPTSGTPVAAAWASTKVAKISFKFTIVAESGNVTREVEQSASTPLYSDSTQKDNAQVAVETAQRPVKASPISVSIDPVVLGTNYTVSWPQVVCPTDTTRTYVVKENGVAKSYPTNSITLQQTNDKLSDVTYNVTTTCVKGELAISSEPSDSVTRAVVPPAPKVTLTTQPAATNAALDAHVGATIQCAYGTAQYGFSRIVTSHGATATGATQNTGVASYTMDKAINDGFATYQGSQYQYSVDGNCISAAGNQSPNGGPVTTNTFTTLLNKPAVPSFYDPIDGATKVDPSYTLGWNATTCAPGTSLQYDLDKTKNYAKASTSNIVIWKAGVTSADVVNTQGNTVGYAVKARCVGSYTSLTAESAVDTVTYTTLVKAPSVPRSVDNNSWFTVSWAAPSTACAPEANLKYRLVQNKANATAGTWRGGETTATSSGLIYSDQKQGYPQGAYVQAYCDGTNDASAWVGSDSTSGTDWVSHIDASLSGNVTYWRKFNGSADCGYGTKPENFRLYLAADGFNPVWGSKQPYAPDGSYVDASYAPTSGGNTGWMTFSVTTNRNVGWITDAAGGYKYWYGNGRSGYATRLVNNNQSIDIYYYNMASFSDNVSWWWYGTCGTPYAKQTSKGSDYLRGAGQGRATKGVGDPGSTYNSVATGFDTKNSGSTTISKGTQLDGGDQIFSPNGRYRLTMNTAGSLYLYNTDSNRTIWTAGSVTGAGNYFVYQNDDNLVVYNSSDKAVWSSSTSSKTSTRLALQDDGNLVLYNGTTAIWNTGTNGA
jgi:hypothetical protein